MSAATSSSLQGDSFSPPVPTPPVFFWYPPYSVPLNDDDFPTHTSREQREVERRVTDSQMYVLPQKKKINKDGKGKFGKKKSFFGGDETSPSEDEADDQGDASPLLTSCPALCELSVASHASYLLSGLMGQSGCHPSLDASRPWLVYWCLHALDVLDCLHSTVTPELALSIVGFLRRCVNPKSGGMGGGPGQQAHTAPTYAGVLSLCILSSFPSEAGSAALALLSEARAGIYQFHMSCKATRAGKQGAGGFRVSRDGEVDTRGSYTALSVASLLNTLTPSLAEGTSEWLADCQSYEGGMGGEPGNEAHGGYTFCGLAALVLLRSSHRVNLPLMLKWSANRQMEREGGFQGRTNKLVDACYSFWVGALFPLLNCLLQMETKNDEANQQQEKVFSPPPVRESPTPSAAPYVPSKSTNPAAGASSYSSSSSTAPSTTAATDDDDSMSIDTSKIPAASFPTSSAAFSHSPETASDFGWLFDTLSLQRYLLVSCQSPLGGIKDKPGKHPDLYHTCYGLSGLSVAQHANEIFNSPLLGKMENSLVSREK